MKDDFKYMYNKLNNTTEKMTTSKRNATSLLLVTKLKKWLHRLRIEQTKVKNCVGKCSMCVHFAEKLLLSPIVGFYANDADGHNGKFEI